MSLALSSLTSLADYARSRAREGASDAEVARDMGVNITTVRRIARELGVEFKDGSCRIVSVELDRIERTP